MTVENRFFWPKIFGRFPCKFSFDKGLASDSSCSVFATVPCYGLPLSSSAQHSAFVCAVLVGPSFRSSRPKSIEYFLLTSSKFKSAISTTTARAPADTFGGVMLRCSFLSYPPFSLRHVGRPRSVFSVYSSGRHGRVVGSPAHTKGYLGTLTPEPTTLFFV